MITLLQPQSVMSPSTTLSLNDAIPFSEDQGRTQIKTSQHAIDQMFKQ